MLICEIEITGKTESDLEIQLQAIAERVLNGYTGGEGFSVREEPLHDDEDEDPNDH